jgi:hypothetical protein
MLVFAFVVVHKITEFIVDAIYVYCAYIEVIESPRAQRLSKVIMTIIYLLLR